VPLSLFIVLEGVEGCGKSYQSRVLYKKLIGEGLSALLTYEPGGTKLGDRIRSILKSRHENSMNAVTELFLISASRAQHVSDVIIPALKSNKIVICDRFTGSTVAYQGYGRGLDLNTVQSINMVSSAGIEPNLNILLDLPVEKGLSRKHSSGNDRFEAEDIAFHENVRKGYLEIAEQNSYKWMVVDAGLSREEISDIIWDRVGNLLETSI
jgi:dTMP kinase